MRLSGLKWVVAVALTAPLLAGCSARVAPASKAISAINIDQSDVDSISLISGSIDLKIRVVALANGSAEIVQALGLRHVLAGRDIASDEKSLDSVPVVTSGHQVIAEKIIALHPDVVLIDASTGPSSAIDALHRSKIHTVLIPEAWTLSDIAKKVGAVAHAIGADDSAKALNTKMAKAINQTKISSQVHPRIAFLYLRGTSSIYLMGGPGSGADSLIESVGAVDVGASSLPHAFNSLTSEALVRAKPDILLVMTKGLESVGGIEGLIALPGVAQTPAGKSRRVISVDDSLLLSFGPRTPSLLSSLAEAVVQVMK